MTRELPSLGSIRFAGHACRLPMADSVEEFADLLFSGRCAISQIPENRWRKEPFFHPVPGTRGKAYTFAAGVLRRAEAFDAAPFGISPREAEYMDPQQRLILQVVWEALEDACIVPADLAGQNVGVYMGASMMDHAGNLTTDPALADSYMMTGSSLAVIANRVSHVFDLHGPSLTIDTACSSSLFALEAAYQALSRGEIDTAIVGATNMLMTPAFFVGFSEARMLSPTGLCQAFSDKADGYVRGEGAVAFVLRRCDEGDPPLPRDRGRLVHVGVNTTGKSVNIALPSADAQYALLDKVYRDAGIDPAQLAFIEAHGTGTPVGDPIEAEALGRAVGRWRDERLPIGTVKSNIGHLEPAAGCAGLLKTLIALRHHRLPATLNAAPVNASIPFGDLNLRVADAPIDLDLDDPDRRFAGVSAFGFGGANGHAIVEAPEPVPVVSLAPAAPDRDRIFFTSAFCRDALKVSAAAYRDKVFVTPDRQDRDLLDALLHFRGAHPHRMAVLAADPERAASAIDAALRDEGNPALVEARSALTDQPPVFLFSGNGSQYAGMSLTALDSDAAYRARYEEIDACWQAIAGWSLLDKARDPDLSDQIRLAEIAQPLLFADQLAMVAGLADRGVAPAAVLGHSGGEVAAAAVTGALTLSDALGVLFARATAQSQMAGLGSMAAVQAGEHEVASVLASGDFGSVAISAVNSPRSVSVSGPVADLDRFQRHARRSLRWACVRLKVDYAFHHAMQDPTEETFRGLLGGLAPAPGRVPFLSSVTGITEPGGRLDGDYWWRNIRHPVRFADAVETAAARGYRFFLEIGPDPVLGGYARDVLRDLPDETAVTFVAAKADRQGLNPVQRAVARTLVHGGKVDRTLIARRPQRAPDGLGSYPWQYRDLRVHERSRMVLERAATDPAHHPLLGRPVDGESGIWAREADRHLMPDLADHVIAGKPIMPAMAFGEMALAAARQTLKTDAIELRDLDFIAPLPLHDRSISEVRTAVTGRRNEIRISSRARFSDDPWQPHAGGHALSLSPAEPRPEGPAPALEVLRDDLDATRLYETGKLIGLDYGDGFRRVSRYRLLDERTIEVVLGPEPPSTLHGRTGLDPTGADCVLHGLLGLPGTGRFADAALGFLPVRIGRLLLFTPGVQIRAGRIRVRRIGDRTIHADIDLFSAEGEPIARLESMRFRAVRLLQQVDLDRHAFTMDLVPFDSGQSLALPAPADLVRALRDARAAEPEDEGQLLLNALGYRIAHDGLSTLRAADGLISLPLAAGERATRFTETLAAMLESASLAQRTPDGLRLTEDPDLPTTDALIGGILIERPDLGAECSLLARLSEVMPDLLAGRSEWNPEHLFGQAALTAFAAAASARARAADRVAQVLGRELARLPADRAPRIAEIVDGAPVLLDRLAQYCPGTAEWFRIDGDGAHPASRSRRACGIAAASVLADDAVASGPFDLLVTCTPVLGAGRARAALHDVVPALRDGGLAVAIAPDRHDYLDIIRALGAGGGVETVSTAIRDTSEIAIRPDGVSEDVAIGAWIARAAPRDGATSGTADLPPAASPPRAACEMSVLLDPLLAALRNARPHAAACSVAHHRAADLWLFAPYRAGGGNRPEDPLFVLAPDRRPGQGAERILKERLIVLARLIHDAPAVAKPVWLFVPNGAGYTGALSVSPEQSALWAAMRSAKNEYPVLDIRLVDPGSVGADAGRTMLTGLVTGRTDETEIVLTPQGPASLRVRVGPTQVQQPMDGPAAARLCDDPAGGLETLSWRRGRRPRPGPGEILLEVAATGLNYRDVMWSMGLLPEEALEGGMAGATLGIECAGHVLEVGEDVRRLKPGDDVVVIGPSSFSTHVVVDEAWAIKLPSGLSPEVGASIPVGFFTAYYALHHLARLTAGETVLIHGGAGGVGLAAIQIARDLGARIIATAGSPVKRALLRKLGVEHVVNSRSVGFEADVRTLTKGGGVDVVLNALNGESMERSLALVRPFGRFVELGKQDYYADTAVGLRALKDNVGYFSADLDQLLARRPDLARSLYREMLDLFEGGRLGPIPVRAFAGCDAIEAFRAMQRSEHIGKIVVRPPDPETVAPPQVPAIFRPDDNAELVIFGGGGGLGLALARHQMVRGASAITLVGRSGDVPDAAAAAMARAEAFGCRISYESCDIADRVAVERTLAAIRRRRPIADIVNSAMVLEDMRLAELTHDVLERTMAAKVAGTRNLDQATRGDPVRSFTVFTSMATLIGNHGQASYVAANAYMEGLVRQRRAEGLPGLAVGWGAISDAGYLARDTDRARLLHRMGGGVDFSAGQAARAFDLVAAECNQRAGDAVVWISPMQWQATVKGLRLLNGPTYRALRDLGQDSGADIVFDDLRERIAALPQDRARDQLVGFLKAEIARILRTSDSAIQSNRPVSEAGVDSLMGVELGLAAQQALGDDIPLMSISSAHSIDEIAEKIVEHVHGVSVTSAGPGAFLGDLAAQHVGPPSRSAMSEAQATAAE